MALLVVAGSVAILLVGLFAGAWVDRLCGAAVGTDAIRSLLLLSVIACARVSSGWGSCIS
jgi:hypothetical protein